VAFFIERHERSRNAPTITYKPIKISASDHPCGVVRERLGKDGFFQVIKVTNEGGSNASYCTSRVNISRIDANGQKEVIASDAPLDWTHFFLSAESSESEQAEHAIGMATQQSLGRNIQDFYCRKWNQDLRPHIDEFLEVCFTVRNQNVAYAAICGRRVELPLGETYRLEVQLGGREINEAPRIYQLFLKSYEDIELIERK